MVTNAIDQIYLIMEQTKSIKRCIADNTRRFNTTLQAIDESHQKRRGEARKANEADDDADLAIVGQLSGAKMNSDLLATFVQFKILSRQLRPVLCSFRFIAFIWILLMVCMPLISRVNAHAMSDNMIGVCTSVALVVILWLDSCLVPICYIHSRGNDLCRALFSLAAHAHEIESRSKSMGIYNLHTLKLLEKELSHPDRLAQQFGVAVLGVQLTYANFLRIQFWLGLLLISTTTVRGHQDAGFDLVSFL